jgi:nucleoside-diphosphate-sugar epimerase
MLLVSSPDVYGDAPSPTPEVTTLTVPDEFDPYCAYGGGKIASEMLAIAWLQSGALERLIIARPHNIYGPDMGTDHVIPQFCLRMNELAGDGEWNSQYAGQPLPFPIKGTGQEVRSFCYISDCTDQLITLLDQGDTGVWNVGAENDHSIAYVAQRIGGLYGRTILVRPGSAPQASPPRRVPDLAKIQTLCGYRPRVSFDEGLERTVKWYQANG